MPILIRQIVALAALALGFPFVDGVDAPLLRAIVACHLRSKCSLIQIADVVHRSHLRSVPSVDGPSANGNAMFWGQHLLPFRRLSRIGALRAIGIALAAGLPVAALAGFLLSQSKPEPRTHIIEKSGATVVKPVGNTATVEVLPPEK